MANESVFNTLNAVDVGEHIEKKGDLNYVSWCFAWAETKSRYPDARYTIRCNEDGLPYFKEKEVGYMCITEVTIGDETLMMWLPVMDFRNKAMLNPSMFDINKTLMRCLTKNLAMFGLGLYIYAGEDLPTESTDNKTTESKSKTDKSSEKTKESKSKDDEQPIEDYQESFKGLMEMLSQRGVENYWNDVKTMYNVEKVEDLSYQDLKEVGKMAKEKLIAIDKELAKK